VVGFEFFTGLNLLSKGRMNNLNQLLTLGMNMLEYYLMGFFYELSRVEKINC